MNEDIKLNSFQVILKFRNKYNNCFNLSNTPVMHFTVTLATTLKKMKKKRRRSGKSFIKPTKLQISTSKFQATQ